jgi:hypothetical protein
MVFAYAAVSAAQKPRQPQGTYGSTGPGHSSLRILRHLSAYQRQMQLCSYRVARPMGDVFFPGRGRTGGI